MTDLQQLFSDPIQDMKHFHDVHPGQASDVWLVETTRERVIVRTTRMSQTPADEFWFGCKALFGIDPTDVFAMETINTALAIRSTIPVPRVIGKRHLGQTPFVLVEVLPGQALRRFSDLPLEPIEQLGRGIAVIHQMTNRCCGNFQGTTSYPVEQFHAKIGEILPELVARFHSDDEGITEALPNFVEMSKSIAAPVSASPILLDMDPTQFLSDGTRITGLIDTEVYAFGPSELDLIALEYLLDSERAEVFQCGYTSIREFPHLEELRPLYRYLNRLMSVQGRVPFEDWMNHPVRFRP